MINKFKFEELNKKSKLERIEVCLNCQRMIKCNMIGQFEECMNFLEDESEVFVIKKVDE